MVPDVSRGSSTIGLIHYLYRTSDIEAHVDPHLVAAYDPHLPDPGRDADATFGQLAADLDLWVDALGDKAPKKHVWHCPVRTAPGDRILSDEEWATVARRVLNSTGIAPDGDDQACRWIVVRHAPDHIHIVATLVRADRTRPRHHKDGTHAQAECRKIEKEFGLRRLKEGDGTAAKRPTSAERFKAERLGQEDASRELLREHVHRALAGAADEAEFFDRLVAEGVRVNKRIAPSGDVLGYKVAMPGDRNGDQEPIWFAGSTLAPDLSLPKIRKRFTHTTAEAEHPTPAMPLGRSAPARARLFAAEVAEDVLVVIASADDGTVAAHMKGVGEVLDALAQTSCGYTGTELRDAARYFERATRSHIQARDAQMQALRRAARQIVHSGPALGRGPDGTPTAMVLDVLLLAAIAAVRWYVARGYAQQAEASQRTADHLRAAYNAVAQAPMAVMHANGQRLPAPLRRRHARTVLSVLPPNVAHRLQDEPGWPALAASLHEAELAGRNAAALLKQAADSRELTTADSVSDVLVWRLRRLADLPAPVAAPHQPDRRLAPAAAPTVPQPSEAPMRRR
ncbi:relaxase/mobilization nuclease domain-containing protein [Streptomyces fulvoviolaceus]|uniref:relaxase/mobilization nuclease domain-containing protein n=1 Tax=Streptomyces fulvoviolaceus TaxID=285535 RepID=UPI0021BEAA44|nr:relaxase/mobilization nuclease domain-containing protein [Streptomyces fulvoviolaceus]MCT9076404.1 relaxase/mobilization nuclease domain-containing protein [Streptomyces fulvoviolaceus]